MGYVAASIAVMIVPARKQLNSKLGSRPKEYYVADRQVEGSGDLRPRFSEKGTPGKIPQKGLRANSRVRLPGKNLVGTPAGWKLHLNRQTEPVMRRYKPPPVPGMLRVHRAQRKCAVSFLCVLVAFWQRIRRSRFGRWEPPGWAGGWLAVVVSGGDLGRRGWGFTAFLQSVCR